MPIPFVLKSNRMRYLELNYPGIVMDLSHLKNVIQCLGGNFVIVSPLKIA